MHQTQKTPQIKVRHKHALTLHDRSQDLRLMQNQTRPKALDRTDET